MRRKILADAQPMKALQSAYLGVVLLDASRSTELGGKRSTRTAGTQQVQGSRCSINSSLAPGHGTSRERRWSTISEITGPACLARRQDLQQRRTQILISEISDAPRRSSSVEGSGIRRLDPDPPYTN